VLINQPNFVWSVAKRLREKYPGIFEEQKTLVDKICKALIDQESNAGRQWNLSPRSQAMEPRTFRKLADNEKWKLCHTKPNQHVSVEETSPHSGTPRDDLRKIVGSESQETIRA
jgi:hypothetical protein